MTNAPEELICAAVDSAERVCDTLDDLLTRTQTDPGAPFAPEVLEALVTLRREDRGRFEGLRAQLKRAGCRVTALDEALAEETGEDSGRGPKQADLLIEMAQEAALFHGPDATAFADLQVNGHRETWPVRTKGFKRWLARRFFEATGGAPNSEALQSALNVIEAKAHFDGPEREVHIRIAGLGDKLYLDLGDEAWRIVDEPPVRFRRAAGMQALPTPKPGGSIETLRHFLNVQSDNDFILVVAWGARRAAQPRIGVSYGDEKQHHEDAIRRIQAEYDRLQNRIDAMYVDKLDGRIDTDFFDRKAAEWRGEQQKCLELIRDHQDANQTYFDEGIRLLELAQKVGALFRKQSPSEKRRLLGFVLSNSTWKDGRLTAEYRQPFDLLAKNVIAFEAN